ncbi:hypothetical protein Drorol1_Dr00021984, partial [Drosera rotundifolia]
TGCDNHQHHWPQHTAIKHNANTTSNRATTLLHSFSFVSATLYFDRSPWARKLSPRLSKQKYLGLDLGTRVRVFLDEIWGWRWSEMRWDFDSNRCFDGEKLLSQRTVRFEVGHGRTRVFSGGSEVDGGWTAACFSSKVDTSLVAELDVCALGCCLRFWKELCGVKSRVLKLMELQCYPMVLLRYG